MVRHLLPMSLPECYPCPCHRHEARPWAVESNPFGVKNRTGRNALRPTFNNMPTLTPRTSLSQLGRLRARERFFLLLWGLTCWLAFAAVILAVAIFIDWSIDRSRETPKSLRVLLTVVQLVLYAAAAWFFILRP